MTTHNHDFFNSQTKTISEGGRYKKNIKFLD